MSHLSSKPELIAESIDCIPLSILAIDTSTNACSVALNINSQHFERHQVMERAHTRIIMPMIDSILKEAGICLSQLELLAYGCGPGSFTGVRIAAAIMQGLGFGLNKPIVPISSLRAQAQGAFRLHNRSNVLAVIDAKLNECYYGYYKVDDFGVMQLFESESVVTKDASIFSQENLGRGLWFLTEEYPRAMDIATLALKDYKLGKSVNAKDALPVYLVTPFQENNIKK